jgi:hypothetical protein
MKFIADCMLGTLARWLIILGHDVSYHRRIEDDELVRLARLQRRVILTADRGLARRRDARNHILIGSHLLEEQIRQVLRDRGLKVRRRDLFRRCVACNIRTRAVARASVRDQVPPYVFATQERFTRCPACRRIFWRATHVVRMFEHLARRVRG